MSLLLVSYIPILCPFGHLVSQPIISPLASLCLRPSLIRLSFWCWDYLLKTIFVKGPLRRVYQLNPTDFATS